MSEEKAFKVIEALERLQRLGASGLLTEEEVAQQKASILAAAPTSSNAGGTVPDPLFVRPETLRDISQKSGGLNTKRAGLVTAEHLAQDKVSILAGGSAPSEGASASSDEKGIAPDPLFVRPETLRKISQQSKGKKPNKVALFFGVLFVAVGAIYGVKIFEDMRSQNFEGAWLLLVVIGGAVVAGLFQEYMSEQSKEKCSNCNSELSVAWSGRQHNSTFQRRRRSSWLNADVTETVEAGVETRVLRCPSCKAETTRSSRYKSVIDSNHHFDQR